MSAPIPFLHPSVPSSQLYCWQRISFGLPFGLFPFLDCPIVHMGGLGSQVFLGTLPNLLFLLNLPDPALPPEPLPLHPGIMVPFLRPFERVQIQAFYFVWAIFFFFDKVPPFSREQVLRPLYRPIFTKAELWDSFLSSILVELLFLVQRGSDPHLLPLNNLWFCTCWAGIRRFRVVPWLLY